MQVTEISAQGLKREYSVVLPAAELAAKLESQINDLKGKAKINGFRPGKVPAAHLRKLYGKSIMSEVLQEAVAQANQKIVQDNNLRLAGEPQMNLDDATEIEKVLEAKGDLTFKVAVETLPTFEVGAFDDIEVERLTVEVQEGDVDKSIARMADNIRPFTEKEGDSPAAEKGDKATIDFVGKIDGEIFEGGEGEGIDLVLGSQSFIPGFEDQLIGMKKYEARTIDVTFPEDYASANLAGKPATFEVTLKAIASPGEFALDDSFAEKYGFNALEDLRKAIHDNIERELSRGARAYTKRRLLDALDKRYSFELPQGLVDQEFEGVWRALQQEQQQSGRTFADEDTTEEKAREEYRAIAERRVRLGLLLREIGEKAEVKIEDEELTRALVERARAYPGQEQMIWDYYRKNPESLGEIRAPIFEEKVIDHILAQAKVADRKVTPEELLKLSEEAEKEL